MAISITGGLKKFLFTRFLRYRKMNNAHIYIYYTAFFNFPVS